jgi:WS/DGAT/MGAT family acyltransferase
MVKETPLTALEAAFLYAESELTPMHVGSLAIFDGTDWHDVRGRLRFQALRRHIAARVGGMRRLRQRPVWPPAHLGRPRWVDDLAFDIDRHVRRLHLPRPVSEEQLLSAMAALNMTLLDRAHPLWELWFVDGLEGGRVAMVEKIHHALVDGIGGVDLAMMLLDPAPSPPRRAATARLVAARQPSGLVLLGEAMETAVERPFVLGRHLVSMTTHPARTVKGARHLACAVGSLVPEPFAPRSSLNNTIGPRRHYRIIRFPLEEVRATGHALGGTVNDVVLTAVSAGLAGLLAGRDDEGPGAVHALVPVSVRGTDEHRVLGNRVAAMIVPLPTEQGALLDRFLAVRQASRFAKGHHQQELALAIVTMPEYWPEPLVAALSRFIHRQPFANLVVTNVPGPPIPLYLMGSQMLEVFPLVPLARNLTVSIGILSYGPQLTMGLWADSDRCADLGVLVGGIDEALAALGDRARSVQAHPSTAPRVVPPGAGRFIRGGVEPGLGETVTK